MSVTPISCYILTLGCPKNQVDSDGMAALLLDQGYRLVASPHQADVLIVNTCGFLAASQAESIEVLQELSQSKRRQQILVAAGCLAERNSQIIAAQVPGVDGLLGTRRWMEIVPLVERLRQGRRGRRFERMQLLGDPEQAPAPETPTPRAGSRAPAPISRSAMAATLPAPSARSPASRASCAPILSPRWWPRRRR